ncbi:Putative ribonuclease H protein At1g65750 [Linum perenne]
MVAADESWNLNFICRYLPEEFVEDIAEGLQRAWENGFRKVDARIDSQAILSLIRANNLDEHQHGVDVAALRKLLEGDWEVTITHTYREGNSAADYLADLRHQFPLGVHPISSYDCNLSYFLFATV